MIIQTFASEVQQNFSARKNENFKIIKHILYLSSSSDVLIVTSMIFGIGLLFISSQDLRVI